MTLISNSNPQPQQWGEKEANQKANPNRMRHARMVKRAEDRLKSNLEGTDYLPVPEFEGLYFATKCGRVVSLKTGKILGAGSAPGRYVSVQLSKDGAKTKTHAHRIIAKTFLPPAVPGQEVNHKNGVKSDSRAENLEWVTRGQNIRHAYQTNLRQSGAGMYVLNRFGVAIVSEIHASKGKVSQHQLRKKFGMSRKYIRKIQKEEILTDITKS